MNPIYKFALETEMGGVTRNYTVHPLRKDDLSIDYELEQNEMFYRKKLGGKLTFVRSDYALIDGAAFETQFTLVISISYNNGRNWDEYWRGVFYKTDCEFDADAQSLTVSPTPVDGYTEVLGGMDKEYNLIDLRPEIEHITITKRPLIQMYVPGDSVVSCFLSGMSWEQDCEPVTNESQLINDFHFVLNTSQRVVDVLEKTDAALPDVFNGEIPTNQSVPYAYTNGAYTFNYRIISNGFEWTIELNGNVMWRHRILYTAPPTVPFEMVLEPVNGTGNVTIFVHDVRVYGRYLLDVDSILGVNTFPIADDDIVENNRNYRRVVGYGVSGVVYFSSLTSSTPTEWGIKQPGEYYIPPYLYWNPAMFPLSRSTWGNLSLWFAFSATDFVSEEAGRKEYELKDAYPLHSVIAVLLNEVAPGIAHEPTTEYSRFLYGSINPISGDAFRLYLTQKSNVLAGDYSQPAQKAPVTLKTITDVLRDCFCAYWFIENGKFRIEHIDWFKNGGSYTGTPLISHDLTVEKVTRNGKAWAFGASQYDYEKETMPERFQFGWMDETTRPFDGYAIDVLSRFVTPGNIEEINVSNITSDIDYMLLNPGACSKDGFALMAAQTIGGKTKLPFVRYVVAGVEYRLQNGYLAFVDLQPKYHVYNLPAYDVRINEAEMYATGITRKKKQTLRLPVLYDPNPMRLIKTFIGNGQIEKLSINLSSRNANVTLMFDTYNE